MFLLIKDTQLSHISNNYLRNEILYYKGSRLGLNPEPETKGVKQAKYTQDYHRQPRNQTRTPPLPLTQTLNLTLTLTLNLTQ